MNYQSLKAMVESVASNYLCPSCNSPVNDAALDIIGAAWTSINIDVTCPSCEKHSMIKAEVMNIDVTNMNINREQFDALKDKIGQMKTIVSWKDDAKNSNVDVIKDDQIVDLNKNLRKKDLKVEDLFQ